MRCIVLLLLRALTVACSPKSAILASQCLGPPEPAHVHIVNSESADTGLEGPNVFNTMIGRQVLITPQTMQLCPGTEEGGSLGSLCIAGNLQADHFLDRQRNP